MRDTDTEWIFLTHTKPKIGQYFKVKSCMNTAYGIWNGNEFTKLEKFKGAMVNAPYVKWKPA